MATYHVIIYRCSPRHWFLWNPDRNHVKNGKYLQVVYFNQFRRCAWRRTFLSLLYVYREDKKDGDIAVLKHKRYIYFQLITRIHNYREELSCFFPKCQYIWNYKTYEASSVAYDNQPCFELDDVTSSWLIYVNTEKGQTCNMLTLVPVSL